MAKIIKLTDECKAKLQKEFDEYLSKNTLEDGKFSFSRVFETTNEKARIIMSPIAYIKMVSLLDAFDKEVAWHGEAYRCEDNIYVIKDIMVYPQTVTGASVDMDTGEYAKWIMDNITDERFNNIKMQAHSHVNMSTSPSSVDLQHQSDIVSQLRDDDFYIFMIWNKSLKCTNRIYDMQKNIMFEDNDITIELGMNEFIENAKSLVKERVSTPPYRYYQYENKANIEKYDDKKVTKTEGNSKKKEEASLKALEEDKDLFLGWQGIDRYLDDEYRKALEEDMPWDLI